MTYQIVSKAGVDYGEWQGETEVHALAEMHRTAGVSVSVVACTSSFQPAMFFDDERDAEIAGYVEDWIIIPVYTSTRLGKVTIPE